MSTRAIIYPVIEDNGAFQPIIMIEFALDGDGLPRAQRTLTVKDAVTVRDELVVAIEKAKLMQEASHLLANAPRLQRG